MTSSYVPQPLDVSGVSVPTDLEPLLEQLAEHAHDIWAELRMADNWRWGPIRSDAEKLHPCLVHYGALPEPEKDYDRQIVIGVLRATLALGFTIVKS
jgi:RyR domain